MTRSRPFDVVIFGVTGTTGSQAAQYLARRAGPEVRWAVAGRSPDRLAEIGEKFGVPHLVADVTRAPSLDELAASTAVVANFVGPYARHGASVYEACIRNGTSQVDACGEIDWLRTQIERLDADAIEAGVRVVHTAGFEALPFDVGTRVLAEDARRRGSRLLEVDVAATMRRDPPIVSVMDLISGGTLASGADALRRGNVTSMRDARYLDVDPHETMPFDLSPRQHPGTKGWLGPMAPSPHINPAIVQQSERLLRSTGLFDTGFRFREGLTADDLVPGALPQVAATVMSATQHWNRAMTGAPSVVRSWAADLTRMLGPRIGTGPNVAGLDAWSWSLDFHATASDGTCTALGVEGVGHPGYRSSANLVAETAVALAVDDSLDPTPGFRTPAALGLDPGRFVDCGVEFGVVRRAG